MAYTIARLKFLLLMSLAFVGILSSPLSGIAQGRAFKLSPVAVRGDRVTSGGHFLADKWSSGYISGLRSLNNRGEVVFNGNVSSSCFYGTYMSSEGRISTIADYRCTPTPIGTFVLLDSASINDSGQVLVLGRTDRGDYSVAAMFLYADGELTKIVAEGDNSPIGGVFKGGFLSSAFFSAPTINHNGEVAFLGSSQQDSAGFPRYSVFVYSGGEIRKVIAAGDTSPFGGLFDLTPPGRSISTHQRQRRGFILRAYCF